MKTLPWICAAVAGILALVGFWNRTLQENLAKQYHSEVIGLRVEAREGWEKQLRKDIQKIEELGAAAYARGGELQDQHLRVNRDMLIRTQAYSLLNSPTEKEKADYQNASSEYERLVADFKTDTADAFARAKVAKEISVMLALSLPGGTEQSVPVIR